MATAAKRFCVGSPTCSNLGTYRGRCALHAKQYEQARGTAQQRGYDAIWARASKAFRAAHPICGERHDGTLDKIHSRCAAEGITTAAQCVDHILPMSQGGAKLDPTNLMSACHRCNVARRNVDHGRRGVGR